MKKKLLFLTSLFTILLSIKTYADCTLNSNANSSANPLNGCSGVVTINAKLTMNANYNLAASGITQLIISSTGEINWSTNNVNLGLPANCQLIIQTGSLGITSGANGVPCSANRTISFGGVTIVSCNGGGPGIDYEFAQVNANGGINGPLSITASSNSPVCVNNTLNLTSTFSGGISTYSFEWRNPSNSVIASSQNTTVTPAVAGNYTVKITDGSGATTTSVVNVTVSGSAPGAPTSPVDGSRCGTGTVNLSATPVAGATIDWYDVASGGSVLAGGTGTNTFTTPSISGTTTYYAESRNTSGCAGVSATRTAVIATVNPNVTPTISITSTQVNLCTNGVEFSSSITNGGASPTYQWKKNGANIPLANSSTYSATNLINGDLITCELTSNAVCAAPTVATSNTINVTITSPTTTWLGLTNDWDVGSPINWSNGYPSSNTTAIIVPGTPFQPQVNGVAECFNLIIQSGASVTINGVNTISIYGNLTNDGTLVPGFGEIQFLSCVGNQTTHNISSTNGSTTNFFSLLLDDLNGLTLSSNATIGGFLKLQNGTFTNSGANFTFLSTSSGTARITAVAPTANYVGNITMQRFAPGPLTGWALLGPPVQGATISSWTDDFATSGFTGSTDPSLSFISIYDYDETASGLFDDPASYIPATNTSNALTLGKGKWVYLGTGMVNTANITIDVTGQPHIGNFNFNLTYTNSGNPLDDGFNLIANPYPSAVDWLSVNWTKTNVNNAIYMFQADNGQYASFVNGIATNGGSRFIASSQGFYVQANAASPVLTLTENAKSLSSPVLIKESDKNNVLKLRIVGNNASDEAVIYYEKDATYGFDGNYDAAKFLSTNPLNPSISTVINSRDLCINSIPFEAKTINIPVRVTAGVSGTYEINWNGLNSFAPNACITIEDTENGNIINLKENPNYYFNLNEGVQSPRFVLHINVPLPVSNTLATCNNTNDGSITLQNQSGANSFVQLQSNNQIIASAQFNGPTYTFNNLYPGTYQIIYPEAQICGTMMENIEIKAAKTVNTTINTSATRVGINESITFKAPKSKGVLHQWNFGDGTIANGEIVTHQFTLEGVYNVTLTSIKGNCEDSKSVEISVKSSSSTHRDYVDVQTINGEFYTIFNTEQNITANIKIHNALGQQIGKVITFEGKNGNVLLNLSEVPDGVYIVSINDGLDTVTKKIIK
ncbi:MAG TPA: PKD domain-containing protein [Bacteroidia bacterium]|nr:PKD domain-containing protein [Bacteroidia bacterium]